VNKITNYINANHIDMVKFKGSNDAGYKKVKGALERCMTDIHEKKTKAEAGNAGRRNREASQRKREGQQQCQEHSINMCGHGQVHIGDRNYYPSN
jgi:hypothetical protein